MIAFLKIKKSILLYYISFFLLIVCSSFTSAETVDVDVYSGCLKINLPIEVPLGRCGLKPELNLAYRSTIQNGWLGVGWGLDIGSIQRSTKHGVDYTSQDFEANGLELVPVNVDNAGNGEYRAKIESKFSIYNYKSASGWIVTKTDGTKFYYGQSSASRQDDSPGVFKWCLDRVKDTNDNYMNISYTKDQGQIYLDKIEYTGHTSGLLPTNSIKFYLEDRDDILENYMSLFEIKTAKRLSTIDVQSLDGRVCSYNIEYDSEDNTGRSLIAKIQKYGSDVQLNDDNGEVVDGTGTVDFHKIINWPDVVSHDFTETYLGVGITHYAGQTTTSISEHSRIYPFDYDGNGIDDLLTIDPGSIVRVLNSFDSGDFVQAFPNPSEMLNSGEYDILAGFEFDSVYDRVVIFDFNGDAKDDLFLYKPESGKVVIVQWDAGTTFNTVYENNSGIGGFNFNNLSISVKPFDYNGDGNDDLLLYRGVSDFTVCILKSNGDGTFTSVYNERKFLGKTIGYGYDLIPFDFNGDGLDDIVRYNSSIDQLVFAQSNGDGTFIRKSTIGGGEPCDDYETDEPCVDYETKIIPLDCNGDGLIDLVSQNIDSGVVYIFKNTGTSFLKSQIKSGVTGYKMIHFEYNGDAYGDLLYYNTSTGNVIVSRSNGDGTFSDVYSSSSGIGGYSLSSSGDHVFAFDNNGNNRKDLFIYNTQTFKACTIQSGHDENPDLISSINSSSGSTHNIKYKTKKVSGFRFNTVSLLSVDDGLGNIMDSDFSYMGGIYDNKERKFLGFETASKSTSGKSIHTTFHQDPYRAGLIEKTTQSTSASDSTIITNTWDVETLSSDPERVFVKLSKKTMKSYDDDTMVQTITTYNYDNDHGGVVSSTTSGEGAETVVKITDYDNFGDWVWRVVKETVQPLNKPILRQVDYDYQTTTGNILWKKIWLEGAAEAEQPIVYYGYDTQGYGNQTTLTDARKNTTTTEYDTQTYTFPTKVILPTLDNGVTHVVEYLNYDYRFGSPTIMKDLNNNLTHYYFDVFGRTERVDSPDGGQIVTIYYDDVSPRKILQMVNEKDKGDDIWEKGYGGGSGYEGCIGRGMETYTYVDGLGREIQTTILGENGKTIIQKTLYDSMGREYKTVGPFFGTSTDYYSSDPPVNSPYKEIVFDSKGRVFQTITPVTLADSTAGTIVSTIEYDGLKTTYTDPDGKKKTEIRDYLGNLLEVVENDYYHTFYTYNVVGDLLTVTDDLKNVTTINYDSLGRKINMTDPDMGYLEYTGYDKNGNLVTQVDANNITTAFGYDKLNRLESKTYSNGQHSVTYTYDNTASGANGIGHLHTVDNGSVLIKHTSYDTMGRPLSQSKTIGGAEYTTAYTYDLSGKVDTITYPDNYLLKYDYHDQTGLISHVTGLTDFYSYAYYHDYDVTGSIGTLQFGNDTVTTYTYDPYSKRLMGYHNGYVDVDNSSNNIDYQFIEYGYSFNGNISSIENKLTNTTKSYKYDKLNRLTAEEGGSSSGLHVDVYEYAYDNEGNATHAVSSITKNDVTYNNYTYDENGSMLTGYDFSKPDDVVGRTIMYDAENMPLSINRGGVETIFVYDGNGTRAKKKVNGNTVIYIGNHYEIRNGVTVRYIFGGNTRLAKVQSGAVAFYHKDHLGSSVLMTDEDGNPVGNSFSEYLSFGLDSTDTSGEPKVYKYTDQEFDGETGLYNYNARLYDPVIGMFITADTIVQDFSDPQTLNGYSYCRNNPMVYTDPDGHFFGIDNIIGAIVGAISAGFQSDWDFEAMVAGAGIGFITSGVFEVGQIGGIIGAYAAGASDAVALTIGGVVGGAAAGATGAGLSAACFGGDVGEAMLNGAFNGGLFGGISGYYGKNWSWDRVAVEGVVGGLTESLRGGDFMYGFTQMGSFALANKLYIDLGQISFEAKADININGPRLQGSPPTPGNQCIGLHQTLPQLQRSLGKYGGLLAYHLGAEGGMFMRGLSLVPGMNRFAAQHDAFLGVHPGLITKAPMGTGWFMQTLGTWSISAPLTYAAIGRDIRNSSYR